MPSKRRRGRYGRGTHEQVHTDKKYPVHKKAEQGPVRAFGIAIPGSERRHTSGLGARALADLAYTARDAPRGFLTLGEAVAKDAWEANSRAAGIGGKRRLDLHPQRTNAILAQAGRGFRDELRHPLRHPGNTLLDVVGLAAGGIGTGVRGAAAVRAARGASKVRGVRRALLARPSKSVVAAAVAEKANIDARRERAVRELHAASERGPSVVRSSRARRRRLR